MDPTVSYRPVLFMGAGRYPNITTA